MNLFSRCLLLPVIIFCPFGKKETSPQNHPGKPGIIIGYTNAVAYDDKPAHAKQQTNQTMDIQKITNQTVRAAFEAWQSGDSKKWLSFFTADAKLYDDGNARNFHDFSTQTIGKEKFTSIDKVEDDGKAIYGNFHSPQWGDFKTYFKFYISPDGKFSRLDIRQAN